MTTRDKRTVLGRLSTAAMTLQEVRCHIDDKAANVALVQALGKLREATDRIVVAPR